MCYPIGNFPPLSVNDLKNIITDIERECLCHSWRADWSIEFAFDPYAKQ